MLLLYGHQSWLSGLAGRRPARSPTVVGATAWGQLEQSLLISPARGYSLARIRPDAPVRVQARSQVAQQPQTDVGTGDGRPHLGRHRIGAHRAVTAQAHDDTASHNRSPPPGSRSILALTFVQD